jgi:hypothetical protein
MYTGFVFYIWFARKLRDRAAKTRDGVQVHTVETGRGEDTLFFELT